MDRASDILVKLAIFGFVIVGFSLLDHSFAQSVDDLKRKKEFQKQKEEDLKKQRDRIKKKKKQNEQELKKNKQEMEKLKKEEQQIKKKINKMKKALKKEGFVNEYSLDKYESGEVDKSKLKKKLKKQKNKLRKKREKRKKLKERNEFLRNHIKMEEEILEGLDQEIEETQKKQEKLEEEIEQKKKKQEKENEEKLPEEKKKEELDKKKKKKNELEKDIEELKEKIKDKKKDIKQIKRKLEKKDSDLAKEMSKLFREVFKWIEKLNVFLPTEGPTIDPDKAFNKADKLIKKFKKWKKNNKFARGNRQWILRRRLLKAIKVLKGHFKRLKEQIGQHARLKKKIDELEGQLKDLKKQKNETSADGQEEDSKSDNQPRRGGHQPPLYAGDYSASREYANVGLVTSGIAQGEEYYANRSNEQDEKSSSGVNTKELEQSHRTADSSSYGNAELRAMQLQQQQAVDNTVKSACNTLHSENR